MRRSPFLPNRPFLFNKNGLFPIYQFEAGDQMLKRYTRVSILLFIGNTSLLTMELLHPFFGFWHGVSLSCGSIFAFGMGSSMQYFSRKYIHKMWLLDDGRRVKVQFFNAFWVAKPPQIFQINDFGYLDESRLYNTNVATYQQKFKVYINMHTNRYNSEVHQGLNVDEILQQIFRGREIITDSNKIKYQKRKR